MSSSSGVSGGPARVSIPGSVRKMIQNIKEITGNHSEEEIYAMLKECSMDPNETVQKLLYQDTFHEVKRKRDRRKENLNKEPTESRWKPGIQGRGNRGSQGNYASRHTSHDAGGGKNSSSGKENGMSQISEKNVGASFLPDFQEEKVKEASSSASSQAAIANGPTSEASGGTSAEYDVHAEKGVSQSEAATDSRASLLERPSPITNRNPRVASADGDIHGPEMPDSGSNSEPITAARSSGAYFSASDPVLLPSQDSRPHGVVGAIRREVGIQRAVVEPISTDSGKSTSAIPEIADSNLQAKAPSKSHGIGKNQSLDFSQNVSSTPSVSAVSRPSSNYSNRSQVMGPQKVVPNMEWKPKITSANAGQESGLATSSKVTASVESDTQSRPASSVLHMKETTLELQRKLEESHISESQHIIIPNHLHVPEVEKLGFCFGSFDASFELNASHNSGLESDKSPPISETCEAVEPVTEQNTSQNTLVIVEEGDYADHPLSSSKEPEKILSEEEIHSSAMPEYRDSKLEAAHGGHEYSVVQTSSNPGFGFTQSVLGSQVPPVDSSETQARDVSRLTNFVIQQPYDPASYYAQFYRSGMDNDGRISPFHSAGVSTKYNGNVTVASPQTQSPQEGGSTMVFSAAAQTPLVTQAAGLMQSSIAVTQQPLPVFRQPSGVPLPHYPPNYFPYGPYFPPIYVPPPAVHQFLSNGAFPHQAQAGGVYAAPPAAAAAAKYSLAQYKPGSNTGNSPGIGVPGNYGPYGTAAANYNPNSASAVGNQTSNEDLSASQFKENNVYIGGQQSEGSAIWITAPARDISGLQPSSFYSLPQGQVAFTPTQPSHGAFAGIYHPAQPATAGAVHPLLQQSQTVAGPVDIVGPAASMYQQAQHSQINWPTTY